MVDTQFLSLSLSLLIVLPVFGQITINDNGNVAIKTENTVSVRALNVECNGNNNCGHTGTRYGIYSIADGAYGSYGIRGHAQNGYGGYGVYGSASNNTISYAGYFTGDVYTTGDYLTSDERFKTNIRSLHDENVMDKLGQLTPARFEYLGAGELRQQGLPESHAKVGEHLGILAGEVENLFPELVRDVVHFLNENDIGNGNPPDTVITKAVNYNGLIPVLITAIQEQQQKIEELEARIEALEQ